MFITYYEEQPFASTTLTKIEYIPGEYEDFVGSCAHEELAIEKDINTGLEIAPAKWKENTICMTNIIYIHYGLQSENAPPNSLFN